MTVTVDGDKLQRCCQDAIGTAIEQALDEMSEGMADPEIKAHPPRGTRHQTGRLTLD
jgi:hypothetical protein